MLQRMIIQITLQWLKHLLNQIIIYNLSLLFLPKHTCLVSQSDAAETQPSEMSVIYGICRTK